MIKTLQRKRALRVRKGVIGLLECCTCTFPVERHDTSTEHDKACPAHRMTLSARMAGNSDEYRLEKR